jgi:NAD(P)-dependent dehydrogenase (short-subunit alcohol dehydrogenase family)
MPAPSHHHNRLKGKVAVVTGAGSQGEGIGIGRATAIWMACEGAKVCLVDRERDRANETFEMIQVAGGDAFACDGDVTNVDDCERFILETYQRYGAVDVLVNNVGVAGAPNRLENFDESAWSRVIETNLKSVILMSKAALPYLQSRGGGSIVNVSSIAGIRAHGSGFAYGPSKAALNHLSCELALTYGREGVRVNTVAPGHIFTPLVRELLPDDARVVRRNVSMLGIEGDAWDVAGACVFLASDESRFITGTLIPVDGGVVATAPLAAYALINLPDATR